MRGIGFAVYKIIAIQTKIIEARKYRKTTIIYFLYLFITRIDYVVAIVNLSFNLLK